jgi:sugar lactone lactonase YvrE
MKKLIFLLCCSLFISCKKPSVTTTSVTNGAIITVAGGNGEGSDSSQLYYPSGVFVDTGGNIYVSDQINNRIQKFPPSSTSLTNAITVAGRNVPDSADSGANKLNPSGIFVDNSGNLYVADLGNDRILEFPPGSTSATSGVIIAGGNGPDSATNQLNNPSGIFVDNSGNIYVADLGNNRILEFPPGSTSATNGIIVAGGNYFGSAANQLTEPTGVFVDASGNIYVSDQGNNRIQKFPPGSSSATNGITVAGGNGFGSAANQLAEPTGVFVDASGNIYVSDQGNNRILKFPPGSTSATNGSAVAGGNGFGSAANQFEAPTGVFVDAKGNIYISDYGNNRIQEWVK